jgi:hypothetical protein
LLLNLQTGGGIEVFFIKHVLKEVDAALAAEPRVRGATLHAEVGRLIRQA